MNRPILKKWTCLSLSCLLAFPAFAEMGVVEKQQIRSDVQASLKAESRKALSEIQKEQKESLNCGPNYLPLAELTSLAVTCWDMKKSKDEEPNISEEELLKADRAVCDCLGESPIVAIQTKMNGAAGNPVALPQSAEAIKNFRDNAALARKRIQNLQNGMMFQASILSEANPTYTQAYSQGDMKTALSSISQADTQKTKSDEAASTYMRMRGQTALKTWINPEMRRMQSSVAEGISDSLKSMNVAPADTKLLTNAGFAPGQCVTAREYLGYKLLPSSDSTFYSAIKSKEFHSTDWNYTVLQNSLKELHVGSPEIVKSREKDIKIIKDRMNFLNRNPMFKTFFSVSLATNDEYFNSAKITAEEQNKIINNPGWTNLDAKKANLFNIIKNLNPSDAQSVSKFKEQTAAFFKNSEVGYLTNLEVKKAAARELDELSKPSALMPAKLPSTQKELEAKFAENTSFISPAECTKGGANVEKCVSSYAAYCKLLSDSQEQSENAAVSSDIKADVTFENLDNFDSNMNTNPEFKKFNEAVCNTRRLPGDSRGGAKTFFQFRDEHCKKNQSPMCVSKTPEANAQLRDLYMKEYSTPEVSSNREADKAAMDTFMAANKGMNSTKAMDESSATTIAKSEATPERSKNLLDHITDLFHNGKEEVAKAEEPVVVPTSEGSGFATFARGMESLAGNMGGQTVMPDDVGQAFVPSSVPSMASTAATANDDHKITDDEREKIRAEAQDEILRSKKEIAAATSAAQKESLETRMKLLEELLAQKNDNEAKYQKLIDQLAKNNQAIKADGQVAANQKAESNVARRQINNNFQQSNNFDDFDNQSNRAPASVSDYGGGSSGGTGGGTNGSSSGGGSARVSATARGSSGAVANFNTALLEAQEAKSGRIQKSVDGSIVIASDAESPALKSLSNAATGADYSLSVTAADYVGFENQSVETLKRYQEKLIGSLDANQSVRVLVKSDKKEPLEFFVVKDGGKLFFKPVRKSGATLEALKMAVKKTP